MTNCNGWGLNVMVVNLGIIVMLSSGVPLGGFLFVFVSFYGFFVVLVDFGSDDITIFAYATDDVLLVVLALVHGDVVPVLVTYWGYLHTDRALAIPVGFKVCLQGFVKAFTEVFQDCIVPTDDLPAETISDKS